MQVATYILYLVVCHAVAGCIREDGSVLY